MQKLNQSLAQGHANRRKKLIEDISLFASGGDKVDMESKFNVFVTAHLSKSKQCDIERHCKHFRNVFDRQIVGQRRRLYKILSIEQGSDTYNKFHAHWLFEIPKEVCSSEFELKFTDLWVSICDSVNIDFRPIQYELGGVNGLINYCTKETTYGNYGTFNETCSDNARRQSNRKSLWQLKALNRQEKSIAFTSNEGFRARLSP